MNYYQATRQFVFDFFCEEPIPRTFISLSNVTSWHPPIGHCAVSTSLCPGAKYDQVNVRSGVDQVQVLPHLSLWCLITKYVTWHTSCRITHRKRHFDTDSICSVLVFSLSISYYPPWDGLWKFCFNYEIRSSSEFSDEKLENLHLNLLRPILIMTPTTKGGSPQQWHFYINCYIFLAVLSTRHTISISTSTYLIYVTAKWENSAVWVHILAMNSITMNCDIYISLSIIKYSENFFLSIYFYKILFKYLNLPK